MADRIIWMVMIEEHDGTVTRELELKAFTTLEAAIESINNYTVKKSGAPLDELFDMNWSDPAQYAWNWKATTDDGETDINVLRMRLLDKDDQNGQGDGNGGTGGRGDVIVLNVPDLGRSVVLSDTEFVGLVAQLVTKAKSYPESVLRCITLTGER